MAILPAFKMPRLQQPALAWVLAGAAFATAGILALLMGWGLAVLVESRTAEVIRTRMVTAGHPWAYVSTDGLIVSLSGTAPTEAQRFAAVNLAGSLVDAGRLHDDFAVEPAKVVAPPRFSVEMMRNDDGVQLIGLLPEGDDKANLAEAAAAIPAPKPPNGPTCKPPNETDPPYWSQFCAAPPLLLTSNRPYTTMLSTPSRIPVVLNPTRSLRTHLLGQSPPTCPPS